MAGLVVAYVESLAGRVVDRIVGPGGELIFVAVRRPSVTAAFCSDLEAEARIGDDVDPGRRRRLPRPENRHIFLSAFRKSSQPVEELKLGSAERHGSLGARYGSIFERTDGLDRVGDAIELVGKASLLRHQHNTSGRRQEANASRR